MDIREILASLPHHVPSELDRWNTAGWIASPDCYPVYSRIFARFNPRSVFEIGTQLGYCLVTALHSASRLRDVAWLDNETDLPGSNQLATENIQYYLAQNRRRQVTLRYWTDRADVQGIDPDLVHVDDGHSYPEVLADLEWTLTHFRPRAIICHDVDNPGTPGVLLAINQVIDRYRLVYEHVDALNGIGILTRE